MRRSSVLVAVGVTACFLVAGCSTLGGTTTTVGLSCSLEHEIVDDRSRVDDVEREIAFDALSSPAKRIFNETLDADGTAYSVDSTGATFPDEFEYTDTLTYYEIDRDETTYILAAWTSEGCSV